MTRQDFLGELRNALSGSISQTKINENINYYNNYIIEESRKGRTEEEVIEALGNPRLIAKTILSASSAEWDVSEFEDTYEEKEAELPKGRIAFVLIIAGILLVLLLPVLIPILLVLVILIMIWSRHR